MSYSSNIRCRRQTPERLPYSQTDSAPRSRNSGPSGVTSPASTLRPSPAEKDGSEPSSQFTIRLTAILAPFGHSTFGMRLPYPW